MRAAVALACWGASYASALNITWQRCDAETEAYFQADFPDWTPGPTSPRRRRAAEWVEGWDGESSSTPRPTPSLLSTRFRERPSRGGTPLANATFPGAIRHWATERRRSHRAKYGLPRKPADTSALYERALSAASGCASCETGCCSASQVMFDCGLADGKMDPGPSPTTSASIPLTVYRLRVVGSVAPPLGSPERTAYWLLQGGPGGSGLSILFLGVASLQFATDVLVPDHRGTGQSDPLECPDYETSTVEGEDITSGDVASCVEDLNLLGTPPEYFTSANAARDLGALVAAYASSPGVASTLVHGISYGTRWAQRFLQLFPALATKVVIEGIVARDTVFNDFAPGSQFAGDRLMTKCAAQPSACLLAINDMGAVLSAISEGAATNPCTTSLVGSPSQSPTADLEASVVDFAQSVLYQSLVWGLDGPYNSTVTPGTYTYVDLRTYVLAFVYRWLQCESSDVRPFAGALSYLLQTSGGLTGGSPDSSVTSSSPGRDASFNPDQIDDIALYEDVVYSELWRYPVESEAAYDARMADVYFGSVDTYTDYQGVSSAWIPYLATSEPTLAGLAPNISVPVLLVNGELDGQTPFFQANQTYYDIALTAGTGASKTFALIQDLGHYSTGFGCGQSVLLSFVNGATNTSCAINPAGPVPHLATGFTMDPGYAETLMGSSDLWTGDVTSDFCSLAFAESLGSEDACVRCLDYCVTLFFVDSSQDPCACMAAFATCIYSLGESESRCDAWMERYGTSLDMQAYYGDSSSGSSCSWACTPGAGGPAPAGLSAGEIAGVVIGALLCFPVMLGIVGLVNGRCVRANSGRDATPMGRAEPAPLRPLAAYHVQALPVDPLTASSPGVLYARAIPVGEAGVGVAVVALAVDP